jgi:hypothetical protein
VTYMVGGLSVINAVAGAYSDDLPLLVISGGPNNLDSQERHLIHHTIGETEIYQAARCFEPVVAKAFVIRHWREAPCPFNLPLFTIFYFIFLTFFFLFLDFFIFFVFLDFFPAFFSFVWSILLFFQFYQFIIFTC